MLLGEIVGVILLSAVTANIVLIDGKSAVLEAELEVDLVAEDAVMSEVNVGAVVKAQVRGWLSCSLKMLKLPLSLLSSVKT